MGSCINDEAKSLLEGPEFSLPASTGSSGSFLPDPGPIGFAAPAPKAEGAEFKSMPTVSNLPMTAPFARPGRSAAPEGLPPLFARPGGLAAPEVLPWDKYKDSYTGVKDTMPPMWRDIKTLPTGYYPLEPTSVLFALDETVTLSAITEHIARCLDMICIQSNWKRDEATTVLTTPDNIRMLLSLLKTPDERKVIVEITHLEGCSFTFHKYSRIILDTASGNFNSVLDFIGGADFTSAVEATHVGNVDDDKKQIEKGESFLSEKSAESCSEANGDSKIAVCPQENDVLCARGGLGNNHPGNRWKNTFVAAAKAKYNSLSELTQKKEKRVISKGIVDAVHKEGGRFLEKGRDGLWYEISDREAVRKTSQSLRDKKKKHYISKSKEAVKATTKPIVDDNFREEVTTALDIVRGLMTSDQLDVQQLGLESLCILTDPKRTCMKTSVMASKSALLGVGPEVKQGASPENETNNTSMFGEIREKISSIILNRDLEDIDATAVGKMTIDFDSDDEDFFNDSDGTNDPPTMQDMDAMSNLLNLSLTVVANSLELLVGTEQAKTISVESPGVITERFLKEANNIAVAKGFKRTDMLLSLITELGRKHVRPHNAYVAAKALRYLCKASKSENGWSHCSALGNQVDSASGIQAETSPNMLGFLDDDVDSIFGIENLF